MISLINAKECAERLVIAERVARQASEAALRDADVRERDLSALRKRLEAEIDDLRAERERFLVEHEADVARAEEMERHGGGRKPQRAT